MPNDGRGPVKLLNDQLRLLSSVSLDSELGSVPLNWQLERSNVDNCIMLTIEGGSALEKLVSFTIMVWRDPFSGNSGKEPWTL